MFRSFQEFEQETEDNWSDEEDSLAQLNKRIDRLRRQAQIEDMKRRVSRLENQLKDERNMRRERSKEGWRQHQMPYAHYSSNLPYNMGASNSTCGEEWGEHEASTEWAMQHDTWTAGWHMQRTGWSTQHAGWHTQHADSAVQPCATAQHPGATAQARTHALRPPIWPRQPPQGWQPNHATYDNNGNSNIQWKPFVSYVAPVVENFMHETGKWNRFVAEKLEKLDTIEDSLKSLTRLEQMMEAYFSRADPSQGPHGDLPSQSELSPRVDIKAISLRSGTTYNRPQMAANLAESEPLCDRTDPLCDRTKAPGPQNKPDATPCPAPEEAEPLCNRTKSHATAQGQKKPKKRGPVEPDPRFIPPVPFPQRLARNKTDQDCKSSLEMLQSDRELDVAPPPHVLPIINPLRLTSIEKSNKLEMKHPPIDPINDEFEKKEDGGTTLEVEASDAKNDKFTKIDLSPQLEECLENTDAMKGSKPHIKYCITIEPTMRTTNKEHTKHVSRVLLNHFWVNYDALNGRKVKIR